MMKKIKDENLGPNKYNPKDAIKTRFVINSRTGNYMDTFDNDAEQAPMSKKNRVFEMKKLKDDTQIKPEKSNDRPVKTNISELDVDMFKNIVRDLGRLSEIASHMVDDIDAEKGAHYDEYVMKLKRTFEPLVVTMQRLPDSKDDLGKDETPGEDTKDLEKPESPADLAKKTIGGTGETELDKELQKQKGQGEEEIPDDDANKDMKKNKLAESKAQSYVDKVALKTRTGRIVWVKRTKAPSYISKKGYSIASGAVPRSKRKKSGKPTKTIKKFKMHELYMGSGTHLNMPQDKQEMIDDNVSSRFSVKIPPEARVKELQYMKKAYEDLVKTETSSLVRNVYNEKLKDISDEMRRLNAPAQTNKPSAVPMREDSTNDKRIIMRGTNGKTYAVRSTKAQKYLDKGFTLEKDTVSQMPKTLKVNESNLNNIVSEELKKVVNEIKKHEVKSLKR